MLVGLLVRVEVTVGLGVEVKVGVEGTADGVGVIG